VVAAAALLGGCALLHEGPHLPALPNTVRFDENSFAHKPLATERMATPRPGERPSESVLGTVRRWRIRQGDTFLDIARWFDLGYNEMVDANPGIDPIVPPVGTEVLVPTAWVLPCCTYRGIVVNIPEMRLYYFRPDPANPGTTLVDTYPVGLGREDRRTPRGTFRVVRKDVDPAWYVPESIRQEHMRERGDARRMIPGGDPDNPLGRYRLKLTNELYGIHGTDIPWGIGMEVTHGCVRLYPEDIAHLFPLVPVGTPVEFVYQPVKVGVRAGAVYVEVHRDIYHAGRSLGAATRTALARGRFGDRIEPRLVEGAVQRAAGVPVRVSPERAPSRSAG
jgi:L,D-transpeptidase ErfK/SrfK